MIVYNAEPAIVDFVFTVNDTVDFHFDVERYDETVDDWVAYDMTFMQVDMHVRKCDGTLIKSFTSSGFVPQITILVNSLIFYDTPFTRVGKYKFDIQTLDGVDITTIVKGNLYVQREQTT